VSIYYNDNDPKSAAWLRELIALSVIPPGDVDERSILEVRPRELSKYTQCHFFAGIGGWPFALCLAAWRQGRRVWSGSCPCQPFSTAGDQKVDQDERHLWPAFRGLIAECKPPTCFGEQVASADGRIWLAGVRSDLEELGYGVGAADLCAAGVGAPHIRQRLYWVADADMGRRNTRGRGRRSSGSKSKGRHGVTEQRSGLGVGEPTGSGSAGGLAHLPSAGRQGEHADIDRAELAPAERGGVACGLAHAALPEGARLGPQLEHVPGSAGGDHKLAGDGANGGGLGNATGDNERRDPVPGAHGAGQPAGGSSGAGLRVADPENGGGQNERSGNGSAGQPVGLFSGTGSRTCVRDNSSGGSEVIPENSGTDGRFGFWSDYELIPCGDGKARRIEPSTLEMVNGIPALMGIDRKEGVGKMEAEIEAYAATSNFSAREAMPVLWFALVQETLRDGFGGPVRFSSPPILLSFLRELALEGWLFSEGILRAGQETEEVLMRSLWWEAHPPCSPHRRGLEEQRCEQSANPLRVLSSILARHIQAHWGEAIYAYASHGFPLAHGVKGRVGLLRGYGNSIVPQVAAEFITAFLEAEEEILTL
jgi:DNA (cytosine-5)-methyltransferase 1